MMKRLRAEDVDRTVARIDETRVAEQFRNQDRPDAKFVKNGRRQDPAIGRAKARLRTAHGIDSIRRSGRRRIRSAWQWSWLW
jgi:hypothetical protein